MNGDILIAEIEDLKNLDASEIYHRRVNAKEVLITQKEEEFKFAVADDTTKLSGRDYEFHSKAGTNRVWCCPGGDRPKVKLAPIVELSGETEEWIWDTSAAL